jgi:hypothetical protein
MHLVFTILLTISMIFFLNIIDCSIVVAESLTVDLANVHVRAKPNGKSIAIVRKSEMFDILDKRSGWYKIRLEDGREGWIGEGVVSIKDTPVIKTNNDKPANHSDKGERNIASPTTDLIDTPSPSHRIDNFKSRLAYMVATALISAIVAWLFQEFIKRTKYILISKAQANAQRASKEAREEAEKETLNSLTLPVPLGPREKRNSVLVLGLGGVGKTTLINKLFEGDSADYRIATNDVRLYHAVSEFKGFSTSSGYNDDEAYKNTYYAADYKGQNIDSLIRFLILEQKQPFSPLTYGSINSLIFVVDISPPDAPTTLMEKYEQINLNEVRSDLHIKEWSNISLDAIFSFVTSDSLRYVCLFINKIDLLIKRDDELIMNTFKPLINKLAVRSRGALFRIVMGSAEEGTGVTKVKTHLRERSLPEMFTS